MSAIDDTATQELLTRMRRVETRLTAFMGSQGVEINSHPRWVPATDTDGYVDVPALTTSLVSCLSVVPKTCPYRDVEVRFGGARIATLDVDQMNVVHG
jgi:hypothetical protein